MGRDIYHERLELLQKLATVPVWTAFIAFTLTLGYSIVLRASIVEPPDSANVADQFPADIIDWDGPDDHGWWGYTLNPNTDREPHELCEAILAAMEAKGAWGFPGIGIQVYDDSSRRSWARRSADCGRPDVLGRGPGGWWIQ